MTVHQRIERRPDVMLGRPVIRGTRVTVELVLRKLAEGTTIEDLLDGYPSDGQRWRGWGAFRRHPTRTAVP
jgi:uncharacterized protein (DUF433 family)